MRFKNTLYYILTMKCKFCHKKVGLVTLDCKYCSKSYCTSCINLETHRCSGIKAKSEYERSLLSNKLESAFYSKRDKLLPPN